MMPNPLFQQLGGMPQNPMMQMVSEFQKFKQNFSGDAQQEVQKLLNSGRMTQAQYNQLAQTAQQMSRFLGREIEIMPSAPALCNFFQTTRKGGK